MCACVRTCVISNICIMLGREHVVLGWRQVQVQIKRFFCVPRGLPSVGEIVILVCIFFVRNDYRGFLLESITN